MSQTLNKNNKHVFEQICICLSTDMLKMNVKSELLLHWTQIQLGDLEEEKKLGRDERKQRPEGINSAL